ncbi:MAG: PepSY domain-containing protein [Methylococcales bacterium]
MIAEKNTVRLFPDLKTRRKFWLQIHRYIGLSAGAVFVLSGFAGGLSVFWPEVGAQLNPALKKVHGDSSMTYIKPLVSTFRYVLFSGIYLVFTPYVTGLVKLFSPLKLDPGKFVSELNDQQLPITLDQVATITNQYFPDGTYKWIFCPQDPQGVYRVVKRAPLEINRTRPRRTLWLDQYSGKVLYKNDLTADSVGDGFLQWLYPLHNGEAFGLLGRMIIFVTGLVPMLLYVTGVMRWIQKRRAKSGR